MIRDFFFFLGGGSIFLNLAQLALVNLMGKKKNCDKSKGEQSDVRIPIG